MNKPDYPWSLALIGITCLAIMASLYLIFVFVPTERSMGIVQRIFYIHVPAAWVGFLAFLVAFIGGIAYLARREPHWDMVQVATTENGIVFSTIALVTGSLWARPTWNTWWTWDPRLTTTLIMWLYYTAALMLRPMVDSEQRRARFSALLSIVGFVNVPIVFLAIRLWRTIHPVLFTSEGTAMEPSMLATLAVCVVAFTLLYSCLLAIRLRVACLTSEVSRLRSVQVSDELRGVSP